MATSMDHRWGNRFDCGAKIELRWPDGTHSPAILRNISLSGALVETRRQLPLMRQVSLRALTPGATWHRAFIARKSEHGLGLEWFEPGMETAAAFLSPVGERPLPPLAVASGGAS